MPISGEDPWADRRRRAGAPTPVSHSHNQLMSSDHDPRSASADSDAAWALDIVERIPIAVYVDDAETGLAPYSNPELVRLSGRSAEEWATNPDVFYDVVHPDDVEQVEEAWRATCEDGHPFECEYRIRRPDGQVAYVVDRARVLTYRPDGRPKLVVGYIQDVTAERLAQAEAARRASHDELTGLANRRTFAERLGRSLVDAAAGSAQTAVLFLDLDGFKLVNDSLGHAVGDELLRLISTRVRAVTRQADLVARQSGDEFLVLLSAAGASGGDLKQIAETMAGRIRRALAQPFILAEHEVTIGASVGISYFPEHGRTTRELLAAADQAMYEEKAVGKGGIRRRELIAHPEAELGLVAQIRRGLERDEFVLHYQPIVDLRRGDIVGYEALVRWRRGGELVLPGVFLEAMERAGLMGILSEWVIGQACRQQRAWRNAGIDVRVSVNTPPMLLVRRGAAGLLRLIGVCGGDPSGLCVELTESAMMAEGSALERPLLELAAAGVGISIDDFGTGYSSLARLAELPVSTLKIDRVFINDVASTPQAAAIAKTIVALASSLGITALAEGVEHESQRAVLDRAGCELGQGFLWSPAVAAAELELLARRRAA